MAKQTINIGASPNDGTGTPLRTSFDYCNLNFTELYTAVGPSGNNIVCPGSATITGDLTVDTSTLKVDSANNRVGIGTASPNVRMELSVADAAEGARLTASSAWLRLFPYLDATDKTKIQAVNGTNTALSDLTLEGLGLRFNTNAGLSYAISNASIHTWQNVGGIGGTAMTLDSTGLGVGGSPTRKLSIVGSGATYANINSSDNTSLVGILLGGTSTPSAGQLIYDNTANSLALFTSGASRLLIDTSGNVGIGVSTFGTSAAKVLGLANATAPSTSPAGMGQLYVESGALKYRGSSGTVTTLGNA